MFIYLQEARKTREDAAIVMGWRNDPVTLAMSYHSTPKKQSTFYDEYLTDYFAKPLPPLFACHEGKKKGFIRFRDYRGLDRPAVDIGINIGSEYRGRGLGPSAIRRAVEYAFEHGCNIVIAEIKEGNTNSIRAFERAGFTLLDRMEKKVEDTGEIVRIYRFISKRADEIPLTKKRTFIIAEIGSNFKCGNNSRDIKLAQTLIDEAAEAGADAVKFQTYKAETLYVPNAGSSSYLSESGISEPITDIIRDLSMPYEMIPQLYQYCLEKKIEFMSTPFSINDAKAIDPYVKRHKIASYEISHSRLIEFLAGTKKPLIMSTGSSDLNDVEWAVNYFFGHGGTDLSLMQCTARYPAPLSSLNLYVIPMLKARFGLPIGLSDHSRDPIIGPIGAVALGACVIEKHFTLHNKLPGPDHSFAITPDELRDMVRAIRDMEESIGDSKKYVQETEEELYNYARRTIHATRGIKTGEIFIEGENIDILRGGNQRPGVHPRLMDEIAGKGAKRDIPLGDGIQPDDWE